MADIVRCIVAKVAPYLAEPVTHEVQCFFCIDKFKKDLENEEKELKFERDNLQGRAEQAKLRAEVINNRVQSWLNDATNLLKGAEDLERRTEADNGCFGWCPTWRKYQLCKQMAEKIEAMADLIAKSDIQPFSYPAPLPGIQYKSSENFTYFGSTKLAYDQLWAALVDGGIWMIGLYGMGGSGKTTLVTEVGKKAESKLFDRVILITVSQTPNIRNLQEQMAEILHLKLEEKTEEGRAQRLWRTLKDVKRVLIIVDDLWGEFKLEDIGICLDDDYKGRWKVFVTTRRQKICNLMDCQNKIQLGLLSEDEAWTLFQKHARIDDAFNKLLKNVPRELCNECKGLPIAIVTVGSSLKGQSVDEWKVALDSLRHSEAIDDHMDEGVRAALNCLKLSYNYLKNREAKLLFLMCSMFPEDYEFFIEDLIRYAIGLGLGKKFSFDSARSCIRVVINELVDSCLLMHSGKSTHHVKMHDLVRYAALWIARLEDPKILVNHDKPLSTLAEDDGIKEYFAISLWYKEIDQISHQVDAPNLEILSLNTENWHSLDLSHASFEGIKRLKVMAVISKFYSYKSLSLPQSTQLLTSLRTLRLNGWHLGDTSFLISLTRLEILDLRRCRFNQLPDGMGKLKKLKLLDLSSCKIENYNYEAMGRCLELEELYFYGYHNPDYHSQSVVDIITLPNLQRFVIQIGWFRSYDYAGSMRALDLLDFNISNLMASKKNLLQTAENVCLERLHGGCKSIIPDMVGIVGGMNDLSCLALRGRSEIECLIDTTSAHGSSLQVDAWIPRLVKLELSELNNLREVCGGPPRQGLGFFEKLEELYIR